MKSKRYFLVLVSLLLCLVGCHANTSATKGTRQLKIVTSFYPIYALTKTVSGDLNDVKMIQSSQGIHDFEPSTADVEAIYRADVFIYHSHTLESWAGSLGPSLQGSKVKVIEAAKGLKLSRVEGLEDVPVTDNIDPARLYDPHSWNDPILLADEAQNIAKQLKKLDPKNAKTYQKNADDFSKSAKGLTAKYQKIFAKAKSKYFVTQHTAFYYLAKRFGLKQLGISSVTNQEPSARQLAEIEEFVKTYKVKTIFVENAISTKAAKTIAHSTGASIQVLSPLEADPQNNLSLLENIEQNLKVLSQHL